MEYTLQIIGAIAIVLLVLVPIWKFLYHISVDNSVKDHNKATDLMRQSKKLFNKHSVAVDSNNKTLSNEEIELDRQIAEELRIKEEEAYSLIVKARLDEKRARLSELRAKPSDIENEVVSQIDDIKEDETIVQEDIALEKERISGNKRIKAANDRLARQTAMLEELRGTK